MLRKEYKSSYSTSGSTCSHRRVWMVKEFSKLSRFLSGFNQSRLYRQDLLQIPQSMFHENPAGESRAVPSGNVGRTDMARIIITTDCANAPDSSLTRYAKIWVVE
jgi:hypothetical protein